MYKRDSAHITREAMETLHGNLMETEASMETQVAPAFFLAALDGDAETVDKMLSTAGTQSFVFNDSSTIRVQVQEVLTVFRQGVLCTLPTHCGVLLVNFQDVPDVLSTDFSHNFQVVESNRFLVKQCLQIFGTCRKTKLYFRVP